MRFLHTVLKEFERKKKEEKKKKKTQQRQILFKQAFKF